ncbi:MAG: hypothetical protein ACXWUN_00475 [Allosphingosinicella sp.]
MLRVAYRYRTSTLVGPWRRTRLQAELDAVAAGQAMLDHVGDMRWLVDGEIEQDEHAGAPDQAGE